MQIKNGSKVVNTIRVSGSTRSGSVSLTSTGRRSLRAYYLGSDTAAPSTSAVDKVRVHK